MARRRNRSFVSVKIFAANDSTLRTIRVVASESAQSMLDRGTAEAVYSKDVFLGVRLLDHSVPVAGSVVVSLKGERPPDGSSTAFSVAEMDAIAGSNMKDGRSRTMTLTEVQRAERLANKLPEEDLVERAHRKLTAYPKTH